MQGSGALPSLSLEEELAALEAPSTDTTTEPVAAPAPTPPPAPVAATSTPEGGNDQGAVIDAAQSIKGSGLGYAASAIAGTLKSQLDPILYDALRVPMFERNAREAENFMLGVPVKIGTGVLRVANGAVSAALDAWAGAGLAEPHFANDFAMSTQEDLKDLNAQFKKEFGDNFGFAVAEFGGEVLPFLTLPHIAIPKLAMEGLAAFAANTGMAATLGAAEGAAMGAIAPVEGDTMEDRTNRRQQNALVSGALGGVIRGGAENVEALKNWIPETLMRIRETKGEFVARGLQLQRLTGVKFRLDQIIDDAQVDKWVGQLKGSSYKAERLSRHIVDQQVKDMRSYFEKVIKGNRSAGKHMEVYDTFRTVLGDAASGTGLIGTRKTNAARNFGAAKQAGAEIYLGNTLSALDELIEENTSVMAMSGNLAVANEMRRLKVRIMDMAHGKTAAQVEKLNAGGVMALEEILVGGGKVSPKELQVALASVGDAAKGKGVIFKDLETEAQRGPAKKLFAALNRDLDDAIDEGRAGAAALKRARDQYREDSILIDELEETALGKLFKGIDAKQPNPEQVGTALLQMVPSEINQTMRVLGENNPALVEGLQEWVLHRAIKSAEVVGQAGAESTSWVPAKMLNLLHGQKSTQPGFGGVVASSASEAFDAWFGSNPKLHRRVMTGMEAVQRIMVNNERTGGKTVARLRNLAYSAFNLNKGAAASFATDWLTTKMIPKYVMHADSMQALEALSKPIDSTGAIAAMSILASRWLEANPRANEEAAAAEQMGQGAAPGM